MPCKEFWNPKAKQQIQNLLCICRKAGKLELGLEPTRKALRANRICGVLVCQDTSEKSRKEAKFMCSQVQVSCLDIPMTKIEVGQYIGTAAGVLGVLDGGFFRRMTELTMESEAVTT